MVASVETHANLMKKVVEKRQKEGFKKEIVEGALVIGTIDNIDKAQPGAQVHHSVMHRSWHGTSVQAVQPRPNCKRFRETTDLLNSHQQRDSVAIKWSYPHLGFLLLIV